MQKAVHLAKGKWIIAYDKNRLYEDADKVYNGLLEAASKLGVQVGEPEWFELDREDDTNRFSELLESFYGQRGEPQVVLIVLRNEGLYGKFKNICYRYNAPSQVIQARTCRKFNLSVASNILKQINSKLGGDLYNLKFSQNVSPNTMLIGIDVCH